MRKFLTYENAPPVDGASVYICVVWMYSFGVIPKDALKVFVKYDASVKPASSAISAMGLSVERSIAAACLRRRRLSEAFWDSIWLRRQKSLLKHRLTKLREGKDRETVS